MKTQDPRSIHLKDYSAPDYLIDEIKLEVELDPAATQVMASLLVRPNTRKRTPLVLNGEHIDLQEIRLNGDVLERSRYQISPTHLTITDPPNSLFTLQTVSTCAPQANTALTGLYLSKGLFCTQCEAEGFRRIAYSLDRPDIMSVYSTRIVAPRAMAPVMLSNGNCVAKGMLDDGRHFAEWHDPFPKPAYLFALVAGDLTYVEDTFTTLSGRKVALRIYVEPNNEDRCAYAMDVLKRSMKWDEEMFGREYDLDIFMIVAVSAFNMGAMENKGLNIFNDKYILARPDTATDLDYANIESTVAHEYFHNWTGNRITCRDWFQLCLKEGLTVFRDQEFSSDMRSRPVKRIDDVRILRTHQFSEDSGPLAHPVRPASYIEINNFYTATIYEKGAELVRMIYRLVGAERFRTGMDLYFDRHDGQAATVEDFLSSLADGANVDLNQFKRWYEQAGTPEIFVSTNWDAVHQEYTLRLSQITQPTPEQPHKAPLHVPIEIGLVGQDGRDLAVVLEGTHEPAATSHVLQLTQREQTFRFSQVSEKPTPSVLRGFTAPVKLSTNLTERDWAFLMTHDSDPFNRWEAFQKYSTSILTANVRALRTGKNPRVGSDLADMIRNVLGSRYLEPEFKAQMISLPAEATVAQTIGRDVDVDTIHKARELLRKSIAERAWDALLAAYETAAVTGPYAPGAADAGQRSLRNLCLGYLAVGKPEGIGIACAHYDSASNMTDSIAALSVLADHDGHAREEALADFYEKWKDDHLVMDKWLSVQATSSLPDTLVHVRRLTQHPLFSIRNPNKVRSLIGAFATANQVRFHGPGGYAFVADSVLALDKINPQVAARMLGAFKSWRLFDPNRCRQMQIELERVANTAGLSRDVYEIATKTLGQ